MNYKVDISLPNAGKLNNDEYAQFMKGVVKLVNATTAEKLGLKPELITAIETNVELLTEASRQSRSSKESANIMQLDKQRNELLSYLLSSFRLGKKSSLATQKEAATILSLEFKSYKSVSALPTRQKSQAIDALVKDLEKPAINAHLQTLGLTHAVAPLKEANRKYQELVDVRAESQLNSKVIKVKQVRKATNDLFKDLARTTFAYHIVSPSQETTTFTNLLNKLIDDTITANKQRLAQALANKKAPAKPTDSKQEAQP
ncbi:MAG: DUF6261 family protein [Capnocytophaga sp.]|nr:DUF6261 family protein [Capnocytophaga sp.]